MSKPEQPARAILAYCRAGFEAASAAEIGAALKEPPSPRGVAKDTGYVLIPIPASANIERVPQHTQSVFSRQVIFTLDAVAALGERDRVTPILAAVPQIMAAYGAVSLANVWVEYPDTNDGKALSKLAGALETRVLAGLSADHVIDSAAKFRLHVFLLNKQEARIGVVEVERASPWPLGIPRLKMPRDAPSRSTLKLAEAFHVFLGDDLERLLQPEMRAVDLGAAPGGWTWQLTHRGLHVMAVDNADLKGELVDNALVRHIREDGFRFRPKKPVDWLVCDMVEQPRRIATLVAMWLAEGHARHAIFNLKLPMKKRLEEIELCKAILHERLEPLGRTYHLVIKQLYHDREEVTAYCGFAPRSR